MVLHSPTVNPRQLDGPNMLQSLALTVAPDEDAPDLTFEQNLWLRLNSEISPEAPETGEATSQGRSNDEDIALLKDHIDEAPDAARDTQLDLGELGQIEELGELGEMGSVPEAEPGFGELALTKEEEDLLAAFEAEGFEGAQSEAPEPELDIEALRSVSEKPDSPQPYAYDQSQYMDIDANQYVDVDEEEEPADEYVDVDDESDYERKRPMEETPRTEEMNQRLDTLHIDQRKKPRLNKQRLVVYVDLSDEEPHTDGSRHGSTRAEADESEEEIAVLSKEEAEALGRFKALLFERRPPANREELEDLRRDHQARQHFAGQSIAQLNDFDTNFSQQLAKFDANTQLLLRSVTELRREVQRLPRDQEDRRRELVQTINKHLEKVEDDMKRTKRIRRYQDILKETIHQRTTRGTQGYGSGQNVYAQPQYAQQYPQNPYGQNPYGQNVYQGAYPNMGNVYSQNVYGQGQPYGNVYNSYGQDDLRHLLELLKDLGEEKIEGMAPTPPELTVSLLNHQRQGLFWLLKREESRAGCILADDMGLGKTVQTIALIAANPSKDPNQKTTLIVGPVSLLRQWAAEIRAKVQAEHRMLVAFFHGAEKRKLTSYALLRMHDIVLVSYTTLASEYKLHYALAIEEANVSTGQNVLPDLDAPTGGYVLPFFGPESTFYRIVLDEAQYIKNKVSQTSKASACLKGIHRLCLTGTPMQNSIDELYPILRFLRLKPYDEEKNFKRDISVALKSNSERYDEYDRKQSMAKLRAILLAVMLRRTKTSKVDGKPLMQLPKRTVERVYVSMGQAEREFYLNLELGIQKKAQRLLSMSTKSAHSDILTLLLRLRQACIHEFLVEIGEENSNKDQSHRHSTWPTMFRHVKAYPPEVLARIERDLRANSSGLSTPKEETFDEATVQLTCPICFDDVGEDLIYLFARCGHMICDGCTETFFEQRRLEEGSGGQASCMTCRQRVERLDLVDFKIFQQVVYDHRTYQDLELMYGAVVGKKRSNAELVNMLIRRHDGFLPSAKMNKVLELINDIFSKSADEKVIVFSLFTSTFDLMGHLLRQHSIKFLRYDGTMNIDEKNRTIQEFYQGDARVLLISLKAGNVGLTLTCANHVVLMDPFWNPFVEEQAMDRAHRFGQQRPVFVYKMLAEKSVEDRITALQDSKKELINLALDENALKKSSHLGRKELGYLFGLNNLN